MLLSLPFTAGGALFWKVLILSLPSLCVGELTWGPWRTIWIVVLLHLVALTSEAVLLQPWSHIPLVLKFLNERDFGFSEGSYGALAMAGWWMPVRYRTPLWLLIAAGITGNTSIHILLHDVRGMASDLGHLLGILWGLPLAWILLRTQSGDPPAQPEPAVSPRRPQ